MKPVFYVLLLQALLLPMAHADSLRDDHPFIGTWKFDLPKLGCQEIYRIRMDGTTLVTSAEEVGESTFSISDQPSGKGFYKWVDKITKDNGKKDCIGELMQVGHEATTYIIFHHTKNKFLLCVSEELNTCIGPFVRLKDERT